METFWVAYAAIVASAVALLELRRWTDERRLKVTVAVETEDMRLADEEAFAVTVVNRSSFAIHVVRAGFRWGPITAGVDLFGPNTMLIGEIGPLGARRVHVVSTDFWKDALTGAATWRKGSPGNARAWIELSTGETFFSQPFLCEIAPDGGVSLQRFLSPSRWQRILKKTIPWSVRMWV